MPYKSNGELPSRVKDHLPEHAQEIYRKAYNNAYDQYADRSERRGGASRESTASRVAWSAVKKEYSKDEGSGRWKRKASKESSKK